MAVKSMILPANMTGSERRERKAIMEAAISSSLSHPNIVQVGMFESIIWLYVKAVFLHDE